MPQGLTRGQSLAVEAVARNSPEAMKFRASGNARAVSVGSEPRTGREGRGVGVDPPRSGCLAPWEGFLTRLSPVAREEVALGLVPHLPGDARPMTLGEAESQPRLSEARGCGEIAHRKAP